MGFFDRVLGKQPRDETDDDRDRPTFGEVMKGDTGPNAGRDWTYGDRWAPSPYRHNQYIQRRRGEIRIDGSNPYIRIWYNGDYDDWKGVVYNSELQYYYAVILHLVASSKKPVRQGAVPKWWGKAAEVNTADGACENLLAMGYLDDLDVADKLLTLKVSDLKAELERLDLPTKGTKQELVCRMVNEAEGAAKRMASLMPLYYTLTDKGRAVVDETPWFAEKLAGDVWYDIGMGQLAVLMKTEPGKPTFDAVRDYYLSLAEAFYVHGRKLDYVNVCQDLGRLYIAVDPDEACYWLAQLIDACHAAGAGSMWSTLAVQIRERCDLVNHEISDRVVRHLQNMYPLHTNIDRIPQAIGAVLDRFD